jgi:outer membrane protein assembly factor BamB
MCFCPQCKIYCPPETTTCPVCGVATPVPESCAVAWTSALPATAAVAPVTFSGGILVTSSSSERAAILEWRAVADGQRGWQCIFNDALITGMIAAGERLLVSLTSTDLLRGQGALVALDGAGDEVWHWATDMQQISAPAVVRDAVYITADAHHLIAVDIATGAEQGRWALPLSVSLAAPAVAGETLYLPCRGPHLLAVALSGALQWRFDASLPENAWLHHTPLLCQDTVFTASSTGVLLALQADSGTLRWQVPVGPPDRPLSPPVTDGERLYVGARDGLYALSLDGQPLWHFHTTQKITAAPVVVGGVVYAACWDRTLYALDAVTGRELWRYAVERHIEVSPLILSTDSTEGTDFASSVQSVETGQAYAVIADAGGTLTSLSRPLSAAELETAGQWEAAAGAYVALGQPLRGAELLESHALPYQAAQLWEIAGDAMRAAVQYEAAGRWERAIALWKKLEQPLRQAEALQQHARTVADEEVQAVLWEQAAALYTKYDQPALAEQCQLEIARCRRQPDIALDIEHAGLVLDQWTKVRFSVHNAGFGPARQLIIHTDRERFEGQAMATQRIGTLAAGAREVRTLDLKPLESGDSVPLRITVDFTDHAGQPLQCVQTIHLPVTQKSSTRAEPTHTQVLRAAARFVDLAVRIFRRNSEGYYPVEIVLANQQHFAGAITADLSTWITSGDTVQDGHALLAVLTADPALAEAWARCRGRAEQRRVRLWLDTAAPELHVLPWELLCEGDLPLAASAATPFSRYLPTTEAWGNAVVTRPLRMLAAISNPTDLAEYNLAALDVAQEQELLTNALSGVDDVQVDFLPAPVTLARLEEHLRTGYHLLHLVGHGVYNTRKQEMALCLQESAGQIQQVSDTEFGAMLARQGIRPRLVVLATCHGATRSNADAWRGMAPALVQAGVPAVVAMQGAVAVSTAQAFTAAFYRVLAEHGTVDLALNQARSLLISQGCSDVALPVLLMRLQDGQVLV